MESWILENSKNIRLGNLNVTLKGRSKAYKLIIIHIMIHLWGCCWSIWGVGFQKLPSLGKYLFISKEPIDCIFAKICACNKYWKSKCRNYSNFPLCISYTIPLGIYKTPCNRSLNRKIKIITYTDFLFYFYAEVMSYLVWNYYFSRLIILWHC